MKPDYEAAFLELRSIWFSTIMPHHKGALHTRCNRCLILAGNSIMGLLELDDEGLLFYQKNKLKRDNGALSIVRMKRARQKTLRKLLR